jgi:beta-glucanase (GH16 family)
MLKTTLALASLFLFTHLAQAQSIEDDFEGNSTINSWFGDDCNLNTNLSNPVSQGINTSNTVLEYHDIGGPYANIRFDAGRNFDLANYSTFSFKIYIPSSGLTGNQNNQVSLKLQDGNLGSPWSTQTEIIKNVSLDQWQTVSFDFASDPYINLDPNSPSPLSRNDLNRVLIQVNGENNSDEVLAYIDDFFYYDTVQTVVSFDQLIWADEFNYTGAIDSSKWFHQTKLPAGGSWYNGEIQHYTDELTNSSVANGELKILAKKETYTDQGVTKQYTSARLNSKFAFKYGRIEVRAKLPTGAGTWPAIWTLGKNISEDGAYWETQGFGNTPWPACGEMDIMEHWGTNQNYVSSATHTPSSFGGTINHGGQVIPTASTDYHVYALEWTNEKLVFSVDSVTHFVYNPPIKDAATWPFDDEQYILLNIAIEPGIVGSFTESAMDIDYVRVYQQSSNVSIKEAANISKPGLKAFPNPVINELNIDISGMTGKPETLSIFSMDGQKIKTLKPLVSNQQIQVTNLDSLAPGAYLAIFEMEGQKQEVKFIKN